MPQQTSPMDRLVHALAQRAARDYLRDQAQQRREESGDRTNRATLPDRRNAA